MEFKSAIGKQICINCYVYKIRRASGITFVTLRYNSQLLQSVYIPEICDTPLSEICEGAFVKVSATVKEEQRAPYGFELTLKSFTVLSRPETEYEIPLTEPTLGVTLDVNMKNRALTMRHPKESAIIAIKGAAEFAFSQFMEDSGYTRVSTPKIRKSHSDTDYISVKYFGENASLVKGPDIYKKMCMGAFDKVYETGAGYSSRNRNSTRHLNEFTRLDFEIAYPNGLTDIAKIITDAINYMLNRVYETQSDQLQTLGVTVLQSVSIPQITFSQAMDILKKPVSAFELDPTDKAKLCKYSKDEYQSELLFVTDLPESERPFYAKNALILLYNGITVASGSVDISDYDEFKKALADKSGYDGLKSAYEYALPPHGGGVIGLERFIMQLLGLENIRRATLFPRDLHYLEP